jgi:hypothetical protein
MSPHALPLRAAVMTTFRSRVKSVPLAPQSLDGLMAWLEGGLKPAAGDHESHAAGDEVVAQLAPAADSAGSLQVLSELRSSLYHAPGRETESRTMWREALATAAFASQLAEARGASVAVAACGGLLHRAGEAFALRSMALAESEHGVRIDGPSKSELCSTHGRALADRLVREWNLPSAVGVCVMGWRRFGEFSAVSPEASAVYFGHLLSGELLHPYLTSSGALDAAVSELGIEAAAVDQIRARTQEVRDLVNTLE